MASAMDVANFFIHISPSLDEPMTMLRAMKLTYFAQGCSLACLEEPLFDEDVEAWRYGPVVPSVHKALAPFRKNKIKKTVGDYRKDAFSAEQTQLMIDVGLKYGKYTTGTLVRMSHATNGPWCRVYEENRRHIKIPKQLMRTHFTENEPLDRFNIEDIIKIMRPAGPKGSDGSTTLPRDYDDY
ncbi:MAG: DUF4065 domain-containing protein [Methanomassiliicoccaceae archaeon]|nr:DUF4065 domain-containing protein [Methanomassiliicoccaceae archaeon]